MAKKKSFDSVQSGSTTTAPLAQFAPDSSTNPDQWQGIIWDDDPTVRMGAPDSTNEVKVPGQFFTPNDDQPLDDPSNDVRRLNNGNMSSSKDNFSAMLLNYARQAGMV